MIEAARKSPTGSLGAPARRGLSSHATERHMDTYASLQHVAARLGVRIVQVSAHLGWRQEADRLMETAETILARRREVWRPSRQHGNRSRARVERELSRLRQVIREDGEYASQKSRHRNRTANLRIHGRKSNNWSPQRRPGCGPMKHLRQDWNSLIEDARQAAIPLFYAKGYMDIVVRVQTIAENPDIPAKSRAPLIQVLENHQHYLSTRKYILEYPGEAQRHMDARATSPTTLWRIRKLSKPRNCGLPGLAAGGRAPHGGGQGHPLQYGNLWRPS